ncbi:Predicted PurR-regulated permease PerM [Clostridium acidisoli DSM 12555]|uniref:Predicted PurR-regulated permease PerM n=1 Tax=Clostridium acidisoli DSM 12555 TaxID=1121291 RepID=A0A1W1XCA2_9CLOT|nr:AI-2E family transporter [Clostridium acidisoli]SMC21675.1 Predicted PurR-regulated permease PerM [Clostridium acidisoli DSM 12555]
MYKKIIECFLLLIFFIAIDLLIRNYFSPFFTIIILLLLALPIFKFLCKYNIFNININAIITIILINLIIFIIIVYGSSVIFIKIKHIVLIIFSNLSIGNIDKQFKIANYFQIEDILEKSKGYILDILNFNNMQKGAFFTTDLVISYFVANVSLYFILVDNCAIVKCVKTYISEKKLLLIKKKFREIKKIVLIETLLVLSTTVQTIFGFIILEINSGIFLGILCGVLDILPYVGTLIVFLPLVIYNIYLKKYIIAIGLTFLYILLQLNRQIMEAKFMSINLKIHPLLMLISLYIGSKIFGLPGLIIGPIYLLIVKEIIIS